MGCYDTIFVPCPTCGQKYPAQSKSGPCDLDDFELVDAPFDVLENVNRHAPFCCSCGTKFAVELEIVPKVVVVPESKVVVVPEHNPLLTPK